MKFGIDRLLAEPELRAPLKGKRVALLAHPASVTRDLTHSLDALMACSDLTISAAFGPQHGMRGDKQDNMVESPDFNDPRHGLTLGELGHWFIKTKKLDVDYRVIEMDDYDPYAGPGFGWPLGQRTWVNPSPNAPNLFMARAYAGTVMLEGATLSEGRGTTRPLELFGAPDIDARKVIDAMQALAPDWLAGCRLRDCWFEPTFHKHVKQLCNGVQIHTEDPSYDHEAFKPWRIQALAFKAIRRLYPDYPLWRGADFKYEYTDGRLAIDIINGGPALREWVDNPNAAPADLDALTIPDEEAWLIERRPFLLY
jgi:uncharacterized protein YbbC (DUF1343 family)